MTPKLKTILAPFGPLPKSLIQLVKKLNSSTEEYNLNAIPMESALVRAENKAKYPPFKYLYTKSNLKFELKIKADNSFIFFLLFKLNNPYQLTEKIYFILN